MLTLDQLPFQAEGCRHLVALVTSYGKLRIGPTIGSRRGGEPWQTDVAIALSQTCKSMHAWYFSTFDDDSRVKSTHDVHREALE